MSYESALERVDRLEVSTDEIGLLASYSPLQAVRYVQIDRGSLQGRMEGYQLPSGFLWGTWANVGGVGQADIPRGTLLCALTGPEAGRDSWHGRTVEPNSLAVGTWQCGLQHRAGREHQVWSWLFSETHLLGEAEGLGRVLRPLHEPLSGPSSLALQATLKRCLRLLQEPGWPGQADKLLQVEACLVEATVHTLSQPLTPTSLGNTSLKIAESARNYLDRHPSGPLRISDLCLQLGVCERTLRYHFSRTYQCSPSEYHLSLRLNRVRRVLLGAEPGRVGQIAAIHGFWHMGRFCQQYRALFGQTPSQTRHSRG